MIIDPASPLFFLFIYLARVTDVSLGTLRSVLASKGQRKIVPFIGFFEVLIWLMAASQVLGNLTSLYGYIAWAGGYATGIYTGLLLEEKLAIGNQVIRIIVSEPCSLLLEKFTQAGIGFTSLDGHGARGPVNLIFTIVKRKEVPQVIQLLREVNPTAFYSVEDVRDATSTGYPSGKKPGNAMLKFFPLTK